MYGIEGLLAGRTLADRYRIDAVIGRGGMGAVYRSRDLRLGRAVAVKVISVAVPDAAAHERLRARFQREARAAAALHHPNVVSVYDYGTDTELGLDFLVMELLRGEDLAVRLARKGPPSVTAAVQILYQAARGLSAGHRAGLIHRDVKPGNLFLEPGDRPGEIQVRVLDFGIAEIAAAEEETMTHLTVLGRSPFSPAYASPEQLLGEASLTPATDVFSLGAVGFHLLTGRRAFNSADPKEQATQIEQGVRNDLRKVRGLPTAVLTALQRSLALTPAGRFPHAGAFAEAILLGLPSDSGGDRITADAPGAGPSAEPDLTLLIEPAPGGGTTTRASTPISLGTRYATPVPRATAWMPRVSPITPPPPIRLPVSIESVRPSVPASASAATMQPAIAAPPGRLRLAMMAVWNFLLTTGAFVLFAAVWFLAVTALREHELDQFYLACAATVAVTPVAMHRIMGSRGSLRFSVLGSIVASLATVYLLTDNPAADAETSLAALFMAQLVAVVLAEILTRRRTLEDLEEDLFPVSEG